MLEERCNHALPHFVYDTSHQVYLSHGDDIYNRLYKTSKIQFPPLELLINHYKFDQWFDKNLPPETICNNVGRRALELVVEYIPDEILKIYCDDRSKSRSHEEGRLFNEIFKEHISLKELTAFGFWDRIEKKLEESGGCKNIL